MAKSRKAWSHQGPSRVQRDSVNATFFCFNPGPQLMQQVYNFIIIK
jgi:hypothetical protein